MDITYHYPPELFEALINCIPLLFRSKKAVIHFFLGAGVKSEDIYDIQSIVENDKESITKWEIVRRIISRLNEKGEPALRERREILKRVVEFDDFSICWPADMYKAKGIVADIRLIVEKKDTFTRLKIELDQERQKRKDEHLDRIKEIQEKEEALEKIKKELFTLFTLSDDQSQLRGKRLEMVLNKIFEIWEVLIREAFSFVKEPGEGISEQIDGVIEIDGFIFLVEAKWWKRPLGKADISPHLVNIYSRSHAGGIIISNSGYTSPAIEVCKEALTQKIIILCELEEIVIACEKRYDIKHLFKEKIRAAVTEKNPYCRPTIG